MFPKSRPSSDHIELVHWITQYAPDSSEDMDCVLPFEFNDDDFDSNENSDFDWE